MQNKLLTIRDVSLILGISEKEVIDLVESGKLPAYKIAEVYLRFKPQDVEEFKKTYFKDRTSFKESYTLKEKISDFFYYYDFYILAGIIILILLLVILRS